MQREVESKIRTFVEYQAGIRRIDENRKLKARPCRAVCLEGEIEPVKSDIVMSDTLQNFSFDDLDNKIIEILKRDGRASNQKIATALNVTNSVIATRIRRMEEARAMKVVAVADFSAHNCNILMPVGVDVKGRPADAVAAEIAQIEEVASVQLCTGKHDIELLITLEDMTQLSDLLLQKLAQIRGVRSLDPAIAVDVLKFDFDVAPI